MLFFNGFHCLSLGGIANTAENLSIGLRFGRVEKKAKRRRQRSNGRKSHRTISVLNMFLNCCMFFFAIT
jgi:hypothetical protein